MALQIITGQGSLLALGFSLSDIATTWTLAQRAGSWLTASSGDTNLLKLLDMDEFDIITRRGVLDVPLFNKRWGRSISYFVNSQPTTVTGDVAETHLEKVGLFTAIMIAIVGTLEAFTTNPIVKKIVKSLLLKLLMATEQGDAVAIAQCSHRLNSWRSAAAVRGLSSEARRIRQLLISDKVILDGFFPGGDVEHLTEFLYWMLAGKSAEYVTSSSDVAGVAFCLCELANIDWLEVRGLQSRMALNSKPCHIEYNPEIATLLPGRSKLSRQDVFTRLPCTAVNLKAPEESFSSFPLDPHTVDKCRSAWIQGSRVAHAMKIVMETDNQNPDVLNYRVASASAEDVSLHNESRQRVRPQIMQLVSIMAFKTEDRICQVLQTILKEESDDTLEWLGDQWPAVYGKLRDISSPNFTDQTRINCYTVVQAFFIGYYYEVLLTIVDVSLLQIQVIEGAWGFRSTSWHSLTTSILVGQSYTHNKLIEALTMFFLGGDAQIKQQRGYNSQTKSDTLLGVVRKRALLMGSIVSTSRANKFVLLDVDASSIPTDVYGNINVGVADQERGSYMEEEDFIIERRFSTILPQEDVTFHIEPDWDNDPETMVMCVRYHGRRVRTVDPIRMEMTIMRSQQSALPDRYPNRVPRPGERQYPNMDDVQIHHWTIFDLLSKGIPRVTPFPEYSVLSMHIPVAHSRLRYFISYLLRRYGVSVIFITSKDGLEDIAFDEIKRSVQEYVPIYRLLIVYPN